MLPTVDLGAGATAVMISVGSIHNCAVLTDGRVKCWGANYHAALGLGDTQNRGHAPGTMGDALLAVDLGAGRTAVSVAAGSASTCALLDNGAVKCWGDNQTGQLGLGDTIPRGGAPGTMGDNLPAVDLGTGRTAHAVGTNGNILSPEGFACAALDDGSLKCWGNNTSGKLGLGDTFPRGVAPGQMGDALPTVKLFSDVW